jgi:hypothetical protein
MSSFKNARKVIQVLEDTRVAYDIEKNHLNGDFADYASQQAISEFRRAFGDPELTYEQLSKILRCATNKERRRQCKTPWAMFMANFIERNGNSNIHIRH